MKKSTILAVHWPGLPLQEDSRMGHDAMSLSGEELLSYDDVVRTLTDLGCERLGPAAQEHGLWALPGRGSFTVPELGEDKECPLHVVANIVAYFERPRNL